MILFPLELSNTSPISEPMFVKNRVGLLYDRVKVVKKDTENFYLFSSSICSHVLSCKTYIPPEGSYYSDIKIFDSLKSELLELYPNNDLQIC